MEQGEIGRLVKEIIEKTHLMSLGTTDESGPWISDVIHVCDEHIHLYWISETSTRHSQAIEREPRVAATITLSHRAKEPNQGIQISGFAERIDGEHPELANKHLIKRGKSPLAEGATFLDEGESWYRLTPTMIELIYEPLLGYEKEKLNLE